MNTSDVLNKAADLIEERGWTQGATGFYGPSLCVLGGITAALGVSANGNRVRIYGSDAAQALYVHLGVESDDPWTSGPAVWRWNDAMGRTAAEVIEVLRACAVIEQAREEQDAAWATYAGLVTA